MKLRAFDIVPENINDIISEDLGLAMLLELTDGFQQEQVKNGRRICINLNTANDNRSSAVDKQKSVRVSS